MPTNIVSSIRIPVVIGKNRLRGNSEGAMVFDDYGQDNLHTLRNILKDEAKAAGVEPTTDWLTTAIRQTLELFESGFKNWQQNKDGTIGFVYECCMPSGRSLLLGDPRVLSRLA